MREAAALTVARGVATAIEVAGEIALTAVRPEHGVLPACTFALQGLDDLPVFELRVCEAHARCAAQSSSWIVGGRIWKRGAEVPG